MKHFARFTALILSIALCFSLAACAAGDYSYIMTDKDGNKTASGLYSLDLISSYNDAAELLGNDVVGADYFLNVIDGQTFKDYVNSQTLVLLKNQVAVHKKAEELGLSPDEEAHNQYVQSCQTSYDSDPAYYESYGITVDDMIYYQDSYLLQDAIFDYYYGEGGELAISEEEIQQYLLDNYALILSVGSQYTDEDDAEKVAEQKEAMKGYVERINSGESSFTDIAKEFYYFGFNEEEIATLEEAYGDSAPTFEESSYKQLVDVTGDSELAQKIKTAEQGKCFYYEEGSTYRIVYVKDILQDEETLEEYNSYAPYLLRGDDFSAKLAEWVDSYGFEANNACVKKFDIQKIVTGKFKLN